MIKPRIYLVYGKMKNYFSNRLQFVEREREWRVEYEKNLLIVEVGKGMKWSVEDD